MAGPAGISPVVRVFRWVGTVVLTVLALLVISFAVTNRGTVALELWPLPLTVPVPIYLLTFGAALAGFLAGGIVAWMSGHKWRRRARQRASEVTMLKGELAEAKRKAEAPPPPSAPAPAPTGAPPRQIAVGE